jgi:osmotically-inducible protein OsmY
MKNNQINRDSKEFAPMDEYTLADDEESVEYKTLEVRGLQGRVEELLYLHPEFDDRYLHVSVSDGKVTLMGRVSTLMDKNLAESLVMELDGVVKVINLLEIDARDSWMNSSEDENLSKGLF